MKTNLLMIAIFFLVGAMALLLWGCPPPVVKVRPPEPRIEVYGPPPHPDMVWIPGYWRHRRGEWIWVPGHWERRPKPHAVWIPGRWEPARGGWVWVPGHWEYR